VSAHHWRIDPGLASDLAAALGWAPEHGAAALTTRLPERVPAGSTAKLAAVARGDVPPGSDADDLARVVLDHQLTWADGTPAVSPSPSWSCWVFTTLMASLVDWADLAPVQVAGLRRIDERAPIVDFHAAVVVGDGDSPLICDPYFGLVVTLPAQLDTATIADTAIGTATADRGVDGTWSFDAQLARWDNGCGYRMVAPALDRGDVQAFCAVSVTHSGVPSKPYARLHRGAQVVDVVAHVDRSATASRWERAPDGQVVEAVAERATWDEAVDVFAGWTGCRIT
jgi:hypothetical protein